MHSVENVVLILSFYIIDTISYFDIVQCFVTIWYNLLLL